MPDGAALKQAAQTFAAVLDTAVAVEEEFFIDSKTFVLGLAHGVHHEVAAQVVGILYSIRKTAAAMGA